MHVKQLSGTDEAFVWLAVSTKSGIKRIWKNWLGLAATPARARLVLGRLANCGAGIQTDLSELAYCRRRRVIGLGIW